MSVADAARRRRSRSKVGPSAPDRAELLELVSAAATVADHSGLSPWRLVELRGDDRLVVGRSIAAAQGATGPSAAKLEAKSLRAPLLLAVVVSPRESRKVPYWEQESVASGVAHLLSLLLDEAGWGVMWRTGTETRASEVHAAHGLAPHEALLGWLYVGDAGDREPKPRKVVDAARFVTPLPGTAAGAQGVDRQGEGAGHEHEARDEDERVGLTRAEGVREQGHAAQQHDEGDEGGDDRGHGDS